ncbi:MAG: DNA-binding response regulator [Bacteroidetes bacterium]|nr:DNA-binding response regulator [Bacteroidota bacterium]
MTRVLIIEDEIIIARFIEQQLKAHFSCETAIAISLAEARREMPRLLPHLVLCDINLQATKTGIQLIGELRQQYSFEVIYITSYQAKSIIEQAVSSGAANYIIKPVDEMHLFAGVRLVMEKIEERHRRTEQLPDAALNSTERRIVQLVSVRKSTREIADLLHISPHTVKNQRHKICRKLGLKDENNALLKWALEHAEQLR